MGMVGRHRTWAFLVVAGFVHVNWIFPTGPHVLRLTQSGRLSAFVPIPLQSRFGPVQPLKAVVIATTAASAGAIPAFGADFSVPDIGRFAGTVFNIITKGADEVYDPTTEEGAKAMGLAFPVPKNEDLPSVTPTDFLPIFCIIVLAVVWGVLVVPNMMDRADGSKTQFFPAKEEKDVEEAIKVQVEAPVVAVKRLSKVDEPVVSKKKTSPTKKVSGFGKKKG